MHRRGLPRQAAVGILGSNGGIRRGHHVAWHLPAQLRGRRRRRSFPALVALWGTEPLPGHGGERYFTRLTLIYTGNRTYRVGNKLYSLPPTATYPLSPDGGA